MRRLTTLAPRGPCWSAASLSAGGPSGPGRGVGAARFERSGPRSDRGCPRGWSSDLCDRACQSRPSREDESDRDDERAVRGPRSQAMRPPGRHVERIGSVAAPFSSRFLESRSPHAPGGRAHELRYRRPRRRIARRTRLRRISRPRTTRTTRPKRSCFACSVGPVRMASAGIPESFAGWADRSALSSGCRATRDRVLRPRMRELLVAREDSSNESLDTYARNRLRRQLAARDSFDDFNPRLLRAIAEVWPKHNGRTRSGLPRSSSVIANPTSDLSVGGFDWLRIDTKRTGTSLPKALSLRLVRCSARSLWPVLDTQRRAGTPRRACSISSATDVPILSSSYQGACASCARVPPTSGFDWDPFCGSGSRDGLIPPTRTACATASFLPRGGAVEARSVVLRFSVRAGRGAGRRSSARQGAASGFDLLRTLS